MKKIVLLSMACWLGAGLRAIGIEAQSSASATRPGIAAGSTVTPRTAVINGRSPNIFAEVQKMVQGGADAQVINAYVKNWSALYWVSADQILQLHESGTPNEVVIALIERSAELRADALAKAAAARSSNLVTTNVAAANTGTVVYPQMAQPANTVYYPVVYSYPRYPAYTYSSLYPHWTWPSYSYLYWSAPLFYYSSFSYAKPFHRHSKPFYRHHAPVYRHHAPVHRPWYGRGNHHPTFVGRPGHAYHGPRYSYAGHRGGGAWSPATGGYRVSHAGRFGRR